ncbi:phosphate signaling complex PhoU family protein [Halarcobacter anaerophilus]|jgi:phosphate transport system protein|uniref:PhoU family transcriptional regulator n=1 Tax=Halarcobacter anaerophilus TaxID=877500 RepID=A0A4V1LQB6_9BACT|nr:PhoU domain-containing protein [Halarcobacter anaerophilus]QDF27787.1 phosphate transport system regulatory protein [Halarcobacter anaerophilus]RXJ64128.1 PhoU family transcriptional regulator [Halarcobacter anaerophilus]
MLKPYEENLQKIREEIYGIGEEIIYANKISLSALKENDLSMLKDVTLSIKNLSIKTNEIDNLIVKTLALYSPEAKDLREMVSYLKITNEMLRAGANSKIFVKTFRQSFTNDLDKHSILEYAIPLLKASNSAFEIAVSLLKETDDKAIEAGFRKVSVEESKTDDLYAIIGKNTLKLISKNIELSKDYFDVLSSLRRLEKTADRAASIANLILFARVGGEIEQAK